MLQQQFVEHVVATLEVVVVAVAAVVAERYVIGQSLFD